MRTAAALALVLASAPAAAQERRLPLPGFDRVRIEGPVTAELATGRGTMVSVTGDRDALDALEARVDGGTLILSSRLPVRARLTTGNLQSVALAGPAAIRVDRMRGDRLRIAGQGAARIDVARLEAERLDLVSSGSSRLTLAGRARQANVSAQGSGAIEADGLNVGALTVASEGDGVLALRATDSARVSLAGSGEVRVAGTARCTVAQQGPGTVSCALPARSGRR